MKFSRISFNSIRFKLTVGAFAITLPLLALLTYNNFYAIDVVRHQVAESNKNMMSLYIRLIDKDLQDTDQYLKTLTANATDLEIMENSQTPEADYELAKIDLYNKLLLDIPNYQSVDSFFVYAPAKQDWMNVHRMNQDNVWSNEIRNYIEKMLIPNVQITNAWTVHKINQSYYLMYISRTGNTFVGAWVDTNTLLSPLSLIRIGDKGAALFMNDKGEPMAYSEFVLSKGIDLSRDMKDYYITGFNKDYLVVGEPSSKGDFILVAVIPDNTILENLPYLNQIVYIIIACAILLVPAILLFLRKTVLIPINRIVNIMKRVGEGNVNSRIVPFATSDEFMIVNQTFNRMMSQIEELKINVYEEKLNKQKVELQHLQLQMNPHFFLNSLNIIYNFAQEKNYGLIQEMSLNLIHYFRYMFRSNLSYVPLKDELEHVRNYIRIQELRYPESFACTIEVPDLLLHTPVPVFVINTYVENTIKHSVSLDDFIHLDIRIELTITEKEPCIRILVEDTGLGFPEAVLKRLQSGNRLEDEDGRHVGMWNVQYRLQLLYGDRATIHYRNAVPHGAVIQLMLPVQPEIRRDYNDQSIDR